MLILNFAYPLTSEHLQIIETLTDQAVDAVRDIHVQFDNERPFIKQIRALADGIGLTPYEWQTQPILVNPPSYNFGAVTLLVELHGRMGYFPSIIRMKPANDGGVTRYEVAEIINLQSIRSATREERR